MIPATDNAAAGATGSPAAGGGDHSAGGAVEVSILRGSVMRSLPIGRLLGGNGECFGPVKRRSMLLDDLIPCLPPTNQERPQPSVGAFNAPVARIGGYGVLL